MIPTICSRFLAWPKRLTRSGQDQSSTLPHLSFHYALNSTASEFRYAESGHCILLTHQPSEPNASIWSNIHKITAHKRESPSVTKRPSSASHCAQNLHTLCRLNRPRHIHGPTVPGDVCFVTGAMVLSSASVIRDHQTTRHIVTRSK